MRPIISIVGKSKSGKTTLLEGLVIELKQRGYEVADRALQVVEVGAKASSRAAHGRTICCRRCSL